MPKKTGRNTKGRIVAAAWKLFYEQGYDNTTVEDIVFASETSKGSFYHYFGSKDDLLGSLSIIFDEKYEELRDDMTVNEIVKAYAMFERALMYDWCLSGGEYALSKYADQMIPIFLSGFKK